MAVTLKGQTAVYEGVSTDTKPTDADNNAIFKELDTGIRYYYDGTNWNEIPNSGGGGSGTDNYNELSNKPQINSITLSGNKTLDNLGIQGKLTFDDAPTENSNNPVKSGGVYTALGNKQDTISDLSTIRSGAAAGATAVQPQAMSGALAAKQDTLNAAQLAAVNSGITTDIVSADTAALIELVDSGAKNFIPVNFTSRAAGTDKPSITNNGDGSITVDGSRESTSATILVYDISSDATVSTDTTYTLPVGKYVIAATGNTKLKLQVYMHNGTDLVALATSGADIADFEYTSENKTTYPYICWRINANGASTFDNYTFSPMICSKAAWDISQAYQPYRPSYQELYERVLALENA